ncbi:hypothetical protein Salat_2581700 [Sesamum alatum]|uniref:Uncharacterized protein n=1 Tax=Sesamum alatum TaxID=300844 RepID=A0AAE1XNS5_9LAMI|nr:hypothetical protein Salat_2581700 [Sesamum alatum]
MNLEKEPKFKLKNEEIPIAKEFHLMRTNYPVAASDTLPIKEETPVLRFFLSRAADVFPSPGIAKPVIDLMPAKAIATLVIEIGLVNPPTLPKERAASPCILSSSASVALFTFE